MLDIKITNAKTRNTGKELVEIGIENGKITAGYRCKRKPGNRVLCKRTPSSV